ncbi:hypothetical protein AAVH_39049, partial [Aphelenchoides avenae]
MLPKEVLLDILCCLNRFYLDWLPLVNRALRQLVASSNHSLALRTVERAGIHGPVILKVPRKATKPPPPPNEVKKRTSILTCDGHRMELIASWKEQIYWVMLALQHSHVKDLTLGYDGSRVLEKINMSKSVAKMVYASSATISIETLELDGVRLGKLSPALFADLILSFGSQMTLVPTWMSCRGTQINDEFLRRAGQQDVKFTAMLDAMPAEWFQRCDAMGVLDYLFNPDYPLKERFLKLYRFRASKHFLAKMFERMHSTTNIESVQFWSNIRLASQDLKQYEAQHEILQNSDISCVRFRTDVF